jgi:Putative prokaryotic signal transducing protein/zinc-ribbon domain
MGEDSIFCPKCGRAHAPSERFCEACGMPLVHEPGAESETTELQRRARKIKPQYADGPLVKVAVAESQPEAELIAGLLLEEGIPCLLRNSIGGYSPIIGPREVMVPESGAQAAREALRWNKPV